MAKKVKQIAGVDYECFGWQDYIGGPYSYVEKFEQSDAFSIVWRAADKTFLKVLKNPDTKFTCDDLNGGCVQSSFYGKARIAHIESKSGRVYEVLISYNTAVCMLDSTGRFVRLWNGYSATTAKHIRRFTDRYGLQGISKADWLNMPIGKPSGIVAA